jgi:hypothetical protein
VLESLNAEIIDKKIRTADQLYNRVINQMPLKSDGTKLDNYEQGSFWKKFFNSVKELNLVDMAQMLFEDNAFVKNFLEIDYITKMNFRKWMETFSVKHLNLSLAERRKEESVGKIDERIKKRERLKKEMNKAA